jgi:hypothetical protein
MAALFTNNASAPIASSIIASSTSITVSSGQGAEFPTLTGADYFMATLVDTSNNLEIIKVTARTGDTLTVVRAQEGTTARAYSAGSLLELRITAAVLNSLLQVGGAAGSIANTGGWNVTPSGTKLYFNYNGTNVASLDSSGNLITLGSHTAGGTP